MKKNIVGEHWTVMQTEKRPMLSWLELPTINEFINKKISGDKNIDGYQLLRNYKKQFNSTLIVGCGNGQLERDLYKFGLIKSALGIDIAKGSLDFASNMAKKNNINCFKYEMFDLETDKFDNLGKFDLILVPMVAHHIKNLKKFFKSMNSLLTNDGILFMNEYVGPNRFQMNKTTTLIINKLLSSLPKKFRKNHIPGGESYRVVYQNTPEEHFLKVDPSEAVSSEKIEIISKKYLKLDKKLNYGGNINHMLLTGIAENFKDDTFLMKEYLNLLMTFEEILEELNIIKSDFSIFIFRKKINYFFNKFANF